MPRNARRARPDDVPSMTNEQTAAPAEELLEEQDTGTDEAPDTSTAVQPGNLAVTPPPGANVQHLHTTRWNAAAPPVTGNNARPFTPGGYSDVPADPLRDFLDQFKDGDSYSMQVIRDPDPMLRRPPNTTYRRPCNVREILGAVPLMPESFIDDLRAINGNSGGNFTVSVYDSADTYCDSWHGNIGDPVIVNAPAAAANTGTPVDDMDRFLVMLRKQAEMAKLMRDINGVPERAAAVPQQPADPKLQLASLLIDHADVVGTMMRTLSATVEKVTSAAGTAEKPTGFFDAAKQAVLTNPKLQNRLLQTTDKVIDIAARAVGVDAPPPNGAPEMDLNMTDDPDADTDTETVAVEENAEAILLDFLANECAEKRMVTVHHPCFAAYAEDAPDNHSLLMMGLRMYDPEKLIDVILERAAQFDRGAVYRLVFKNPDGVAWVRHLKESTLQSDNTTTEREITT